MGEISWAHEDNRIITHASRRGSSLIEMKATLSEVLHDAPPILGLPHRNVSGLMGLGLPREIRFTPIEKPIEVRQVDMQLSLNGSANDPVDEMGLGRVVEARLHRVDLFSSLLPPLQIPRFTNPLFLARQLNPRVL